MLFSKRPQLTSVLAATLMSMAGCAAEGLSASDKDQTASVGAQSSALKTEEQNPGSEENAKQADGSAPDKAQSYCVPTTFGGCFYLAADCLDVGQRALFGFQISAYDCRPDATLCPDQTAIFYCL